MDKIRVPLQEWISSQTVADEMLWKGAFGYQMMFLRDTLLPLIGRGLPYQKLGDVAQVISTHRSKSIVLPVVSYERPDIGLRLVVRQNFYNWKLSVISERSTKDNLTESLFPRLFYTTPPVDESYTGDPLANCYFEGFPDDLIFGYFAQSPHGGRWSAEIWGDEAMWSTVFAIMSAVGVVKPMQWSVRKAATP
jgi:hypothetical protein